MTKEQLTIAKTLKFSRHDFLNDLQIMLMNMDLGNIEKARETLLKTTEKMKQHSNLSSLRMPETEVWLATFEWQHNAFTKQLTCQVKSPILGVDDQDLLFTLRTIAEKAEKEMNVLSVYTAYMNVLAIEQEWSITIKMTGDLPELPNGVHEKETFVVEEKLAENLWTFTICGR